MRLFAIVLGGFLLFASFFMLRDLLTEDEVASSKGVEVNIQTIDDTEVEESEVEQSMDSSTAKQPVVLVTQYDDTDIDDQATDQSAASMGSSKDNLEDNRIAVKEKREAKIAERTAYLNARTVWRKALNEAHAEAVASGDYTKYEALKRREPTKE